MRTRCAADNRRSARRILPLMLLVLAPGRSQAQPHSENAPAAQDRALSQGQQIASAVSTVTSTSISPLFGVCVMGVYQYIGTPQSARAALPFHAEPIFWIPISVLLVLVFLKDTVGRAL